MNPTFDEPQPTLDTMYADKTDNKDDVGEEHEMFAEKQECSFATNFANFENFNEKLEKM